MTRNNRPYRSGDQLSRSQYLSLIQRGLALGETRFARQTALHWLGIYPGDIPIAVLQAQALFEEGHYRSAYSVVRETIRRDPAYLPAQSLALKIAVALQLPDASEFNGCVYALNGDPDPQIAIPVWSGALRKAQAALDHGDAEEAMAHVLTALACSPETALPAMMHLQLLEKADDAVEYPNRQAVHNLSDHYRQRYPDCVSIMLLRAEAYIEEGLTEQGVALLHQAAAQDLTGETAVRLWGQAHPYRQLWSDKLFAQLDQPLPASVAATFGWNRLIRAPLPDEPEPDGQLDNKNGNGLAVLDEHGYLADDQHNGRVKAAEPTGLNEGNTPVYKPERPARRLPESLLNTEKELERIAERLKQPELVRSDGSFPVYVILSTRLGLQNQYGPDGYKIIDAALRDLQNAVDLRPDWRACLLYIDDPASAARLNIKPRLSSDPWAIKLALADLDQELHRSGEMIGAVLIAGGPQVVPFHHLPNPVDDADMDVPSDNPYTTTDDNYFVSEWPVGRLPGDSSADPEPLVCMIQQAAQAHRMQTNQHERLSLGQIKRSIKAWFRTVIEKSGLSGRTSFGYSAAVWQEAAATVFSPIGKPARLLVSPPADQSDLKEKRKRAYRFGYYNLHGLVDSDAWYGHNNPMAPIPGPDYPVALHPSALTAEPSLPGFVFSEACYGAYIHGKTVAHSLALSFLHNGSRAFIGSTCTSYGSISAPLITADLLGYHFWKLAAAGVAAGEALRRAKLAFIEEMHQRQGYLDGEDQKTLIAFILYGDPLATAAPRQPLPKEVVRRYELPEISTLCERTDHGGGEISTETLAKVKHVVQAYLPGMLDAELAYTTVHPDCLGNADCPTQQLEEQVNIHRAQPEERQVIVLSKSTRNTHHTHPQYARLKLDKDGKLVKLSVSK